MTEAAPSNSEETTEVTDLDTFIKLLAGWHSKRVRRLEEVLNTPEGTEVTMGDEPAFTLTGDALKGFRVGVALALSQLGKLPFEAEYETPPDGPVQ